MNSISVGPKIRAKKSLKPEKIQELIEYLRYTVVGQENLINQLEKDLITSTIYRMGGGPMFVSLNIGSTGVGKNYLWHQIANFLNIPFDIIDCSTLNEYEVNSLFGVGLGYVGNDRPGHIETIFRRVSDETYEESPMAVLLLDESEKLSCNHSNDKYGGIKQLFTAFMGVLENAANVKTKNGEKIMDFSNYWVIFNSNLFVDEIKEITEKKAKKKIGFNMDEDEKGDESGKSLFFQDEISDEMTYDEKIKYLKQQINEIIPHSIYNRLERSIVYFEELSEDHYSRIIELEYNKMIKELNRSTGYLQIDYPPYTAFEAEVISVVNRSLGMRNVRNIINGKILHKIITEYVLPYKPPEYSKLGVLEICEDIANIDFNFSDFTVTDYFKAFTIPF